MKKWLIGCLVTGLILLALGGGLFYWLVWPHISGAGGDIMGQVSELKKIGEAEQAVKNKSSYTAPADGKLSAAQVSAFVAIQQIISEKMGPDFALLEEKIKNMETMESKTAEPELKDIMGGFAGITKLMAKAKQAQAEGLNAQNMSMEEYRWIRDQVSAALPYLTMDAPAASTESGQAVTETPAADANIDPEKAVQDAIAKAQQAAKNAAQEAVQDSIPGGQQIGDIMQGPDSEAARANVELLRPHKELLYKTMTAAWMSM